MLSKKSVQPICFTLVSDDERGHRQRPAGIVFFERCLLQINFRRLLLEDFDFTETGESHASETGIIPYIKSPTWTELHLDHWTNARDVHVRV